MLQPLDTTDRLDRRDESPTPRGGRTAAPQAVRTAVDTTKPERPRLELSLPKVLAGALAAASAAVAASWLGVAGTVVGAVIASVVVSVTTALYSHPIERSSQVIREAIPVVPGRYRPSDATGATETLVLDRSEPPADEDGSPVASSSQSLPPSRQRVRWATVALSSIVMLVVGFGLITGVEAFLGRPVSAIGGHGGGTTLSHLVHRSNGGSDGTHPTPSNGGQTGDSTDSTTGPTDAPTTDAPTTAEPTQTEPTPTEPTQPTNPAPTAPQPTGAAENPAVATP